MSDIREIKPEQIDALTTFLRRNGLQAGDRVAFLGFSMEAEALIQMSVRKVTEVVVALQPHWTSSQINTVLGLSKATYLLIEREEHLKNVPDSWLRSLKIVTLREWNQRERLLKSESGLPE